MYCKPNVIDNFKNGCAVALGNFDGVHLGHQEIIKNCLINAQLLNITPIALSFRPHPAFILSPNNNHKLIIEYDDKIQLIRSMGISEIVELDFTQKFSEISSEEFIKHFLIDKFNTKYLCTGENFFYGFQKRGNINTLMRESILYGFRFQAINHVHMNYQSISSSLIRRLISRGSIETANRMLGRNYKICGLINKGRQIAATTLGFPTANMQWNDNLVKPYPGVYLSRVKIDEIYRTGITNIGYKPTVTSDGNFMTETYLLDFNQDLYNRYLEVEILSFLRPERKFSSILNLKNQIELDVRNAKNTIVM